MTHTLKTWPEYYESIYKGEKTFELRKNDRDYKEGDKIILQKFDPETKQYTGEEMEFVISYLLTDAYQFGLRKGFCIMGIQQLPIYS